MKRILLILFLPTILLAQGKRPNQFSGLQLWIKADSLGKTYSDGGQVDSAANWGTVGGWFIQGTAGNRPLYRSSASLTGLPGIDFDNTNDNLSHPSSTALYNFLHNGTDYTVFIVFIREANGQFDLILGNNGNVTTQVGNTFNMTSADLCQVLITDGVGTAPINNSTSRDFPYANTTQYMAVTYDIDRNPDHLIRMNGIDQSSANNAETPTTSNATNNLMIGFTSAATFNGKILEIFAYNELRSNAEIDSLELYIKEKWIGDIVSIYRSVQPGNTDTLASNNIGTLTISGGTATFSAALPDTVGIGCVIEYDKNNDGTVDNLAFIAGRTSSTVFSVQDSLGDAPDTVTDDDAWHIYHAYISLSNWEAGTENTGITAALRNFDAGNRAVYANNEEWFVALYRGTESGITTVIVDWVTGPFVTENRINLFTPRLSSHVGTSQFHDGNNSAPYGYRYLYTGTGAVSVWTIRSENVTIDGVVMNLVNSPSSGATLLSIGTPGLTTPSGATIKNCIFDGPPPSGGDSSSEGMSLTSTDSVFAKIYNNIIYDFDSQLNVGTGITIGEARVIAYIYNNTVYSCSDYGIRQTAGQAYIRNNLCASNGVADFSGTFTASEYNASSDATASGTGSRTNQTFTFVNVAGRNLRLDDTDAGAKDFGLSLLDDEHIQIVDDMFGTSRPQGTNFDIGAHEVISTTSTSGRRKIIQ